MGLSYLVVLSGGTSCEFLFWLCIVGAHAVGDEARRAGRGVSAWDGLLSRAGHLVRITSPSRSSSPRAEREKGVAQCRRRVLHSS